MASRFLNIIMVTAFCLANSRYGHAFVSPHRPHRARMHPCAPSHISTRHFSISVDKHNKKTSQNKQRQQDNDDYLPPTVEFIDPETQCEVVLLGCFHGTESSSADVQRVLTSTTDVVVLELCATRFADLRKGMEAKQAEQQQKEVGNDALTANKPWLVGYANMIVQTVQKRGLPTGLAAAVLGGFSGMQTALSGFTPGLEFTTALEESIKYDADVILADQVVDETLRKVGSLPKVSWDMVRQENRLEEWLTDAATLKRAVLGVDEKGKGEKSIPQVQLGPMLIRNAAAIQDLVRLTIPPTFFFLLFVQMVTHNQGLVDPSLATAGSISFLEQALHTLSSCGILTLGYVGLALPAVRVILTERDEILTNGIRKACRRAGPGGRVVAVLGLLHVNGIAQRMMTSETNTEQKDDGPTRATAQ